MSPETHSNLKMGKINLFLVLILSVLCDKIFADEAPSNCSEDLRKKFEEWKVKFNVSYSSPEEENKRREIFCANRRKVSDHNQKDSTYTRSENAHTDKSKEEKDGNMLGAKRTANSKSKMDTTKSSQKVKDTSEFSEAAAKTRAPFTTPKRSTLQAMPPVKASTVKATTKNTTTQKTTTKKNTSTQKPTTKPTTAKPTTKATTKTTPKTSASTTTAQSGAIDNLSYSVHSGVMPENLNYTSGCTPVKDQYGCGSCWVMSF